MKKDLDYDKAAWELRIVEIKKKKKKTMETFQKEKQVTQKELGESEWHETFQQSHCKLEYNEEGFWKF